MLRALIEIVRPYFRRLSPSDSLASVILERLVGIMVVVCLYYTVRSADLYETFFLQDGLVFSFPICVFAAALWYILKGSRRYRLNLLWLLFIAPTAAAAIAVGFGGADKIFLQTAIGASILAFIICHMLRMRYELALLKNVLGVIAAIAVLIGFSQNTKEKIWIMAHDLNAYYFSGLMKGGYFPSPEELALFMCAIIPFAVSIISVRNYQSQKKIFALLIFAFMWIGVAFSGSIPAFVYASICILSAPFMYIGSRHIRYRHFARNLFLCTGTFIAIIIDKYYACKLTETDFFSIFKERFGHFFSFLDGASMVPLIGTGTIPENLPSSAAGAIYAFGWIGFAFIALPMLFLAARAYLYWRTLSIEKWPMALMEGNLSDRERNRLLMNMRHAVLNKSITPDETIHTGSALMAFLAFLILPIFSNCASAPSAAFLAATFAAILIRTIQPKSDIHRGHSILRFSTAALLVATALYCVIIPLMEYMN